jgi:hypothetical protein
MAVAEGVGERLFDESDGVLPFYLVDNRTVGDSLAWITYEVVRAA